MRWLGLFLMAFSLGACSLSQSAAAQASAPLRVGIVGLVHGHVQGFLEQSRHSPEISIVGIAEPDTQLAAHYAGQYGFDSAQVFADLEQMLVKVQPEAVLVFTNTFDHRRVVETCARHHVHVMMEKPLAVTLADGLAIKRAAQQGKIQVLVNYETSWYPSNHAAYEIVHEKSIGDIRKVVVHDGHSGPKEIGVGPEFLNWLTDPKLNGGGALFDFTPLIANKILKPGDLTAPKHITIRLRGFSALRVSGEPPLDSLLTIKTKALGKIESPR